MSEKNNARKTFARKYAERKNDIEPNLYNGSVKKNPKAHKDGVSSFNYTL